MRALFFLLLLANLVFWGLLQGWFGTRLPDQREPARLQDQVAADKIRILSKTEVTVLESGKQLPTQPALGDQTPGSAVNQTASNEPTCLEFGGYSTDDAKRIEASVAFLSLGERFAQRSADEAANYIVYIPSLGSQAAANKKSDELRKLGIKDFFVLQEPASFKFALSLGIFRSEESAKKHLETLKTAGVKTAKVGTRSTTVNKVYFKFNPIDQSLRSSLAELRANWPVAANEPTDCSKTALPAGAPR